MTNFVFCCDDARNDERWRICLRKSPRQSQPSREKKSLARPDTRIDKVARSDAINPNYHVLCRLITRAFFVLPLSDASSLVKCGMSGTRLKSSIVSSGISV